ncbi:hypothetical protein, partial [Rhodospira trueperi]
SLVHIVRRSAVHTKHLESRTQSGRKTLLGQALSDSAKNTLKKSGPLKIEDSLLFSLTNH